MPIQHKFKSSFPVDRRQLRTELRAEQDPDGHVGSLRGAAAHVRRPEDHQARVQSNPHQQEDHLSQPRQAWNPRKKNLQGTNETLHPPAEYKYFKLERF